MHHFLPLERLASDAGGDHHASVCGESRDPQPHSPAIEGSDPAQSSSARSRMGRGVESPARCCGNAVCGFGPGSSQAFSSSATRAHVRSASQMTSKAALALIRLYQLLVSPWLPPSCRFLPTCSAYAYEAVEKWGVCRGAWYTLRRLMRCHPLGGHGYDPVP